MNKRFATCLALSAAALLPSALAQNATTTPVGVMTINFPATTQATSKFVSFPLTNPPIFSAAVQAVSANTITVAGTPFSSLTLNSTSSPHFVRFLSGNQAGRTLLVTSHSSDSLTLELTDGTNQTTTLNHSGFTVAAGDRFQIFPGDTIASLFGDGSTGNPLILVGGARARDADTVDVYNQNLGRFNSYYYSTTNGFWRDATTSVSSNNVVIPPNTAISVFRRSGRPALSISFTGEVPTSRVLTKATGPNLNYSASTGVPVDLTLGSWAPQNWVRADRVRDADTIAIFNTSTSRYDTYYQNLAGTWLLAGGASGNYSSVPLAAASGFQIFKRQTVAGAGSYLNMPLPYTP